MTGARLMHEEGHSKLILGDCLEGLGREGGRRGVHDGVHMYTHG